jgi:hypothetical protein
MHRRWQWLQAAVMMHRRWDRLKQAARVQLQQQP